MSVSLSLDDATLLRRMEENLNVLQSRMVTAYTQLFIQCSTLQLCTKKRLIIQNQVNSSEQTMLNSIRATPADCIQWKEELVCCQSVINEKLVVFLILDKRPLSGFHNHDTRAAHTHVDDFFLPQLPSNHHCSCQVSFFKRFPVWSAGAEPNYRTLAQITQKRKIIITNAVSLHVCYCRPQLFPLN